MPHSATPRQSTDGRDLTVLHVVVSLDAGGMEGVLVRVATALTNDGFDVHVCGVERRGLLADSFPEPSHVSTLGKPPGKSFRAVLELYREIRRVRPDIVHTHNLGPLIYGVLATGLGRLCPILHGEHCELTGDQLGPRRLRQRRWLYRCCRRIHTVSRGLEEQLVGLGFPARKIVAVVNGVDTEHFAPGNRLRARSAVGIDGSAPTLGIVGRLVERKRHSLLIEAVSMLQGPHPDLHLLIVGDGELRESLERQSTQLGLHGRIRFVGYQPDPIPFYHAMDMLVIPSRAEGLSNALLEAMACGLPVLTNSACGSSEAVTDGHDGWVRSLSAPGELADELCPLLSVPGSLPAAGRAARRTVEQSFDFRTTVENYAVLYRALAR